MCAVVYKWTRANLASHLFGGLQPWCWTKCQASGRCTWGSHHLEEDPEQRRGCFLCLHGHLSRGHAWNQLHSWRDQSSQQCNSKWNDQVYQPFWKCKNYSLLWSLGWAELLYLMWPPMTIFLWESSMEDFFSNAFIWLNFCDPLYVFMLCFWRCLHFDVLHDFICFFINRDYFKLS